MLVIFPSLSWHCWERPAEARQAEKMTTFSSNHIRYHTFLAPYKLVYGRKSFSSFGQNRKFGRNFRQKPNGRTFGQNCRKFVRISIFRPNLLFRPKKQMFCFCHLWLIQFGWIFGRNYGRMFSRNYIRSYTIINKNRRIPEEFNTDSTQTVIRYRIHERRIRQVAVPSLKILFWNEMLSNERI